MKHLSLTLMLGIFFASCKEPSRQDALGEVTQEYVNAMRNVTHYEERMQNVRHKAEQKEEAIKFLSECLQCAPEGNHEVIKTLSNSISVLESEMSDTWDKHAKYRKDFRNMQFVILNFGEGSYIRTALDTASVDIVEEIIEP